MFERGLVLAPIVADLLIMAMYNKTLTNSREGSMVPKAGIEPARPKGLWILSLVTPLSDNISKCQLTVFPIV